MLRQTDDGGHIAFRLCDSAKGQTHVNNLPQEKNVLDFKKKKLYSNFYILYVLSDNIYNRNSFALTQSLHAITFRGLSL